MVRKPRFVDVRLMVVCFLSVLKLLYVECCVSWVKVGFAVQSSGRRDVWLGNLNMWVLVQGYQSVAETTGIESEEMACYVKTLPSSSIGYFPNKVWVNVNQKHKIEVPLLYHKIFRYLVTCN